MQAYVGLRSRRSPLDSPRDGHVGDVVCVKPVGTAFPWDVVCVKFPILSDSVVQMKTTSLAPQAASVVLGAASFLEVSFRSSSP